jgi:hypothetical protein
MFSPDERSLRRILVCGLTALQNQSWITLMVGRYEMELFAVPRFAILEKDWKRPAVALD